MRASDMPGATVAMLVDAVAPILTELLNASLYLSEPIVLEILQDSNE
jgi:hypothetical protein